MKRDKLFIAVGAALVALICVAQGCQTTDANDPQLVTDSGPGIVLDVNNKFDGLLDDGGEAGCSASCSEDMHTVLDCNGAVLSVCADNEGCLAGGCGDPCKAADANQSGKGCEYYVAPPAESLRQQGCYVIVIANTWTTDVVINVEYQGKALDAEGLARLPPLDADAHGSFRPLPGGKLPSREVALLFLAANDGSCPDGVAPAITDRSIDPYGTTVGDAFRITTDRPVGAVELYPYTSANGGVGSASLLIPTSAWTGNYLAQTPYPHSEVIGPPDSIYVQIVAKEDDTTIEIQPSADIVGLPDDAGLDVSVSSCSKGQSRSYSLNKGQLLQFVQSEELAGSTIFSAKPIGVWGGATLLTVEVDEYSADWVHAQVLPITSLGTEYAAVQYRDRMPGIIENPPWRIVGVKDGTELTYSPKKPEDAPTIINQGEVSTFKFKIGADGGGEAPFPFVVRSQNLEHPFYFWSYMTGGDKYSSYGDPEWLAGMPSEQYARSYTLFTNLIYPETSLVVVRKKMEGGVFGDVSLDCLGSIQGWQDIDSTGSLQYARIDLVTGNFVSENGCSNGKHEMKSDAPFGVTVWGWSTFGNELNDSYAFQAGMVGHSVNKASVGIVH